MTTPEIQNKAPQGRIKRIVREPLFQFLLVGALLFGAHGAFGGESAGRDSRVIEVPPEMIKGLRDEFLLRTGQPAAHSDLEGAVRSYVENEVLYREALRWGLDRDDPIVRRRLVQKMRFVVEDGALAQAPTREKLLAFFESDPERFERPATSSFDHVFLASDRHENLSDDAARVLAALQKNDGDWRARSDGFLWGASFEKVADGRLSEMMGEDAAALIGDLEVGAWQGPVPSPFGLHLVRVRERNAARVPEFEEARTEIYQAFLEDERESARRTAVDELIAGYEVNAEYPEMHVAELAQ
ncbi:MAG: peptidyl-prolyl cis-trans isomerase [Chrysiogenetes bacterium]|nr:peptidyl-prolyl cis-trans isomerase [Chrysiogenetes bacterium]